MSREPLSYHLVPFLAQFRTEVHERADDVDPSNEQDWFSLTLGWGIAKGMAPDDAHTFSIYVRYSTDMA